MKRERKSGVGICLAARSRALEAFGF
jgi:hypothetical protein